MRQFSHVIATDLPYPTLAALNAACRAANRPFYAAAAHGAFGYVFADLLEHEFVVERASPNRRAADASPGAQTRETPTRVVVEVQAQERDGQRSKGGSVVEWVRKRETYSEIGAGAGAPEVGLHAQAVASARRRRQVSPLLACVRALWALEAEADAAAAHRRRRGERRRDRRPGGGATAPRGRRRRRRRRRWPRGCAPATPAR